MWGRRVRYVLLLTTLCAIATCPSGKRACTANTRAQEAEDLLAYLLERIELAFAATGKLPTTPAGPTPETPCCEASEDGACRPDPTLWAAPGWRELAFSIDDPHRFQYQYIPDPSGTSAVLRATGDLDCDGKSSQYEVKLTIGGGKMTRVFTRKDPTE